ncbi:AMP-binding protein [Saccharopolyspora sp. K220]|uniref:class I adenylate-forming enzyme family protein n=1 Tax=Saccharopolyspora soli TaxID=2926618 RepID=UPI001F56BBA8|nr:AMP-binding protein [Saccharopolyspora soli]MCI2423611.1 AMP-binding protein [Saccharopolyspora soli]
MIDSLPRGDAPFDTTGIARDERGIAHYTDIPASLVEMFRSSVERAPDAEAVVEVGRPEPPRVSFQELWDRAARVAGGLADNGVRPGNRVAIVLPAGVDWVVGFLGTQLAGAVSVPVNTRFTEPEIEYVLCDSGSAAVLRPDQPLPDGAPRAVEHLGHDDLAAIFYTSGTAGFPKGAMTTQENFLANVETTIRVLGIDRADGAAQRGLISVPLFHVTGCNSQLLVHLALGAATVVLPAFTVREFLGSLVDERISFVAGVPAIYALSLAQPDFADYDVSGVTRLTYGGAPMTPELAHRIATAFPNARLGNGFGLTETASFATYLPNEWATQHADSVGFAAPVVDLAVHPLATREADGVGELLIRGPNVVRGYWSKPEATRDAFVAGWLRTGDLARVDEAGLVYIVDRSKDVINRGGENVYSVEVENALAGAPGVAESAVLGVPDAVMGEKVGAVLVPVPGDTLDPRAVLDYLDDRLADFKIPQYVVVYEEPLPRNSGGKVLKRQLRQQIKWDVALRGR